MRSSILFISIFGWIHAACDIINIKTQEEEETRERIAVARVYDQFLYPEDLEGVVPEGLSVEDSTKRADNHVKNWIKKQLLIAEAASVINFDEAEIERKILDYRYALMVYEFQKYYVNENLVDDISMDEIERYYEENMDNFELKQNIIKGIFVKVPNDAPRLNRLRRWVKNPTQKSKEDLRSYCYGFAISYQLEDSVWVNFDDLVKTSPIAGIPDKINFLRRTKYYETADSTFQYFLFIRDYKISNELSPIEFEKDNIANILLNKRKIDLARNLEDSIYRLALNKNVFEIYSDQ
jgi:hypothetical protein